ncbi:MAG TPA: DUF917 domain-containing protein [Verrucomicrobiae bacterium]|nr:DUF917 domain-containing protein [Verrucomicrobiae bacterium]
MRRLIGEGELADLAQGAAVLGTGGGGPPYLGMLLARRAVHECGPVSLVSLDELADDACCADVAMMGAPTVLLEKVPSGEEPLRALEALERAHRRTVTHIVCGEAGGVNSMVPVVAAARRGLPMVDADGIGRAFPELQMMMPTLYGITAAPLAITDERGNTGVLRTVDNRWTERIARAITVELGCNASIASYLMTGAQARQALVPRTLTLCLELGEAIRCARAAHRDPVAAVIERLGGRRLFHGRVTDVDRRTVFGFARGHALMRGVGEWADTELRLEFQNEHLVARRDGELVASVPDLIIVLQEATAEPVTTEELRYGLRVEVVGAACDPRWRSQAGLAVAGPRAFGYDHEFVPVAAGGPHLGGASWRA